MSLLSDLRISGETLAFCEEKERELAPVFAAIDKTAERNQWKVLEAFQHFGVAERHFATTTGYGYTDDGRDLLEKIYARIFRGEDALVRPQIISGTHALTLALSGVLRPVLPYISTISTSPAFSPVLTAISYSPRVRLWV